LGTPKVPSPFVAVVVTIPVPRFVIEISTPGILEPLESVTVPEMLAPTT